jgi:hypothetical protein
MMDWAEKNDAEIHGTRDIEAAKHGNLSPAVHEAFKPQHSSEAGTHKQRYQAHTMIAEGYQHMGDYEKSAEHLGHAEKHDLAYFHIVGRRLSKG